MQPLWKTLQRFFKKLKRITIEPSNSTLRYILEKWQALIWKDTHTPIFICSVAQSCLCDAMDSSTAHTKSGLCVNGASQPSHPLSCPSPAFSLSHRQCLWQHHLKFPTYGRRCDTHMYVCMHAHMHTHTHTHRNTTQPLKKKFCHLQWCGWTWRVSC